ncbi:Uma2 family endonuclease [Pseudanabaena sp. CCNP1317]|nr:MULTISPECIES: Uma2 family endonuclease [Pseudanabaena]MEA5487691.1 Uma2 family endonuclease [Pseudanabaena sp. CCNP1317]WGS70840.1 Uma2 family endonuclease [Pseudanabaena galeata CCNP1313]
MFAAFLSFREPRNSWVVWEEDGRYPDLIIELLSDSTANVDRTIKRNLYAERFHTPEYFYFSPDTLEFAGFRLDINQYKPITANAQGWLWSEVIGAFLGIHERQLRYFSLEGALLPTPQETAQREIQKANQERIKAEQQIHRAELAESKLQELQEKMRSLGIADE